MLPHGQECGTGSLPLMLMTALRIGKRLAIRITSAKAVPYSIPTSLPAALHNDIYVLKLIEENETRFLSSAPAQKEGLVGLWFEPGTRGGHEACLPHPHSWLFDLEVVHYYRGYQFKFTSPYRFLWHHVSLGALRFQMWDLFAQRVFNRRSLVRQKRMEILSFIHDQTMSAPDFKTDVFWLMTELYSMRWVQHPEHQSLETYYGLVLESLAKNGDLVEDRGTYQLTAQGLTTLDRYQEEYKRHRENTAIQRTLSALTLGLLIVGLPPAISAATDLWRKLFG